MANDVAVIQSWFKSMPYKMQRELAGKLRSIADNLASDIEAVAPVKTGALKASVRVRRGRNTLEYFVEAGGKDNDWKNQQGSGRGSDAAYDYSLAIEFGTKKMEAKPFFYKTYREKRDAMREEIAQAVYEVSGKI
jgi:HK97 gp10 family phage protein